MQKGRNLGKSGSLPAKLDLALRTARRAAAKAGTLLCRELATYCKSWSISLSSNADCKRLIWVCLSGSQILLWNSCGSSWRS